MGNVPALCAVQNEINLLWAQEIWHAQPLLNIYLRYHMDEIPSEEEVTTRTVAALNLVQDCFRMNNVSFK